MFTRNRHILSLSKKTTKKQNKIKNKNNNKTTTKKGKLCRCVQSIVDRY